jgi:hypothetical protein
MEFSHQLYTGYAVTVEIDGKHTYMHIRKVNAEGEIGASLLKKRLTIPIKKLTFKKEDVQMLYKQMNKRELEGIKDVKEDVIKLNFAEAIDEILLQHDEYIENIDEIRETEKEQEREIEAEELEEIASDFRTFLEDNEITLFGYLEYLSRWFSGGEARNTLIGFLCHFGTFSGTKPLWFMALGKAGEGKSFIEEASLKLVPTKFIENGLKTPAALTRKGQTHGLDYLDRKILTMGDLGDPKDYEDYRKLMHKYKKMTTEGCDEFEAVGDVVDEVTGVRPTVLMELYGYLSVCFTSVNSENVDDQFLSRGITVTPEATDEQVDKFVEYTQSGSLWEEKTRDMVLNELPMLHGFLQNLTNNQAFGVINPYYYCLKDWFKDDEYFKRALKKYPELVKIVTYLNSDEREIVSYEDKAFYVATKEDNMVIAQLMHPNSNLSGVAIEVFNQLVKYYNEYNHDEHDLYKSEVIELEDCKTIFGINSAKRKLRNNRRFRGLQYGEIINNLAEAGLIVPIGKIGKSNYNVYTLNQTTPYEKKEIDFDEKLINKYVENIECIYGPPVSEIRKIISNEKSTNYSQNPYGKLKPAPWF